MWRGLEKQIVSTLLTGVLLTACATASPTPECGTDRPSGSATISCEQAVAVARARLPASHAEVTRIQFLHGDFRPILPQLGWTGVRAYVVFTFASHSRQAVALTLFEGQLSAETPQPY